MEIKTYFIEQNKTYMDKFYYILEKVCKTIKDDSIVTNISKGITLCERTNNLLSENDISIGTVVRIQSELYENLKPLITAVEKRVELFL